MRQIVHDNLSVMNMDYNEKTLEEMVNQACADYLKEYSQKKKAKGVKFAEEEKSPTAKIYAMGWGINDTIEKVHTEMKKYQIIETSENVEELQEAIRISEEVMAFIESKTEYEEELGKIKDSIHKCSNIINSYERYSNGFDNAYDEEERQLYEEYIREVQKAKKELPRLEDEQKKLKDKEKDFSAKTEEFANTLEKFGYYFDKNTMDYWMVNASSQFNDYYGDMKYMNQTAKNRLKL